MMQVIGYMASGAIRAEIDGLEVTVPDDPANSDRQRIAEWEAEGNAVPAYEPPPVTAADVKAECRRRILLIMTEDQQRNTLAAGQAATMQFGADPANWPEPLQQRQQEAMTAWAEIERLRARSNEIEAMEPMPAEVTADELWSASS